MNAIKYREVLEENLFQSAGNLRLGRQFTFQHDNDPKHPAKTMLPSQSPDLNPTHLWRDLKMTVLIRFPSNLMELERICRKNGMNCPNPGVQSL
ncbi:hypothetical protein LDENG_00119070 [Lucifuga dentata]|nr:hypothetical protein LDENG_00119070 [Lucifuga dentata]